MPNDGPDTRHWPQCTECGRIMRLVGIESDDKDPRRNLHTHECACGELIVIEVTQL